MKNIHLFLIVLFSLTFSFNSFAETLLCKITHTLSDSVRSLYSISLQNGDLSYLRLVTERYGEIEEDRILTIEQLNNNDLGIPIVAEKFVTSNINNLTKEKGGHIILNYAYNIINNTRKIFEFDLIRNGDEWSIQNEHSEIINNIHLIINTRYLVPIGVKEFILN